MLITNGASTEQSISLMRVMQLVSPSLPVGAYAYSQALEYAVHATWVSDEESARDWMQGILLHNLAHGDLVVLKRLFIAWQCGSKNDVTRWNDYLFAIRETSELAAEDSQMGRALKRLLLDLDVKDVDMLESLKPCCYATSFSFACEKWQVSQQNALIAYAYSWVENQIAAAIKLIPLGQTAGQRLLEKLMPDIEKAVLIAEGVFDDDIGYSLPAMSLASSLHETQYSRLFRS